VESLHDLQTLCLDHNDFRPSFANTRMTDVYRKRRNLHDKCAFNDAFEYQLSNVTVSASGVVLSLSRKDQNVARKGTKTVEMSRKGIIFIEEGYYSTKYPEMTELILDGNSNFEFPVKAVFLIHEKLEDFSCVQCNTNTIYDETFAKLPSLTRLNLTSTGLHTISSNAFTNNQNLLYLIIDHNQLTSLPYETIDKTPKLTDLSMNGNLGFSLQKHRIFLYHEHLQRFHCNKCGLKQIDGDTFSRMPGLTHLDLQNNKIHQIQEDAFVKNKNLKHINLNNNMFHTFPVEAVQGLKKLTVLCLEHNSWYEYLGFDENNGNLRELINKNELFANPHCDCYSECFFEKLPMLTTTSAQVTTTTTSITMTTTTTAAFENKIISDDEEITKEIQTEDPLKNIKSLKYMSDGSNQSSTSKISYKSTTFLCLLVFKFIF
jgi:Leucine-rich repeat (LRR) protein